ncbi:MAG TPA: SIS domain-containing protein [Candidatus Obscuribacterales bacterium]
MPSTDLQSAISRKVRESASVSARFFEDSQPLIERIAFEMAARFADQGKLFVMGNGGSACDAEHVAVEFMHPIYEKRIPLPAYALSGNTALVTAVANDVDFSRVYATQLERLAGERDICLVLTTSGMSANLVEAVRQAKRMGMMTVAFSGKDGGRLNDLVDYNLVVPSYSIHRIQEAHVLLLHVVWDVVHCQMGAEDII